MPFDIRLEREDLEGLPETVAITDLYQEADDGKYRFVPKIEGVKPASEFDKLNEALRKERNDHKAVKDKFKAIGDRDVDSMLAELDQLEELKAQLEAKGDGIDDEKLEQLVEKRLARIKAPLDRSIAALTEERDLASTSLAEKSKQLDDLIIGQHLNELASKHCDPAVVRDVVEIGRAYLVRDENGEVVTKDEVALPAAEWLRTQLDERDHWNKPTGNGGGGRGNRGGGSGKKNPFHSDNYDFDTRRWRPGALKAQDDYRVEHGADAWRSAAQAAGANPDRPGSAPARPNGRAAA